MPVQTLDLLSQQGVAGLLAEKHQQLADGIVNQPPRFDFALAGFAFDRFWLGG